VFFVQRKDRFRHSISEIMFEIQIESGPRKVLRGLDVPLRMRIAEEVYSLSTRFMDGKLLSGKLDGCRSHRVGDYRIIFDVDFKRSRVHILRIAHRKDVYRTA
jgi:mRNA interferase RelE/StbE